MCNYCINGEECNGWEYKVSEICYIICIEYKIRIYIENIKYRVNSIELL